MITACSGSSSDSTGSQCNDLIPIPEPVPSSPPVCDAPTNDTITLSGNVEFERVLHDGDDVGLNYSQVRLDAARAVTVQLVNSNNGAVLATTTTDDSGFYSFTAPTNTAVYVRVRAEMVQSGSASWNVRVVDNTRNQALYTIAGDDACTGVTDESRDIVATLGWTGTGYNTATRQSGPFAILDTIYQGMQLVINSQSSITFPALTVNWSINNTNEPGDLACGEISTSFFNPNTDSLYLLGSENNDTDEFDQHVVAHEWSHYLEFNFSRSDSIGGFHTDGDRLDMRVAFGEGYGNAMSAIILNDTVYKDAIGTNQSSGFAFDVETEPLFNAGWYSEQSVQQIFYDLYDATNENANGITDNLNMDFAPLWDVLKNEQRSGLPLTSIFSFITALKANNLAESANIDALVNSFDINSSSTDAYGANETNDANATPDTVLPVYTDLPLGVTPTRVCVTNEFGDIQPRSNALGMRRFMTFSIPSNGNYRFTASFATQSIGNPSSPPPPADPDLALHQAGLLGIAQAVGSTEQVCTSMNSGDYILELYDYSLFFLPSDNSSRCFDVSIVSTGSC